MRFPALWCLLLASTATAFAQPCSPVRFRSAAEGAFAPIRPRVVKAGLERRPDGSFTRHDYYLLANALSGSVETGPTTQTYAAEMFGCSGYPTPPIAAASPASFSAERPGMSSAKYQLADLTGDGRTSIAVVERRIARDSVIVGLGTAGYDLSGDLVAYPTGPNPSEALVADFNGDGFGDLAVVFDGAFDGSMAAGVSLLLNNGDGTFQAAKNAALGGFASSAAAGDWNRDGRLDLAVSQSQPQSVVFLPGVGDGTFGAATQIHNFALPDLISGDVDGDGRLDLAGSTGEGFVYFPGTPAGGLGPAAVVDTGAVGAYSVVLGDFNGDGRMDVAQGSLSGQFVAVSLAQGGGRYGAPMRYLAGRDPVELHAIDFDGDGALDLVVGGGHPARIGPNTEGGQIAVLRGRGDGTFLGAQAIGGDQPSGVAAADFNGDGVDDLALPVRGGLEVWLNDGSGTFRAPTMTALSSANNLGAAAAADLDGDGSADVLVADLSGRVIALRGRGDGTFDPPSTQQAPGGVAQIAVGDFDGDGRDDAAAAGPNGAAVFLSTPNGSLGTARSLATSGPFRGAAIAAGDLNGDGRDDLAVVDSGEFETRDGKIVILLSTGGGAFSTATTLVAEKNPGAALLFDLNADGALDLAVAAAGESFRDYLVVFLGDGHGGFGAGESRSTDFGPSAVLAADLSGDGRPELIVTHCCGSTDPGYYLNQGGGSYQDEVAFFSGSNSNALAAGDFNGDGLTDLAVQANGNPPAGVSVLINAAEAAASGPVHVSAASFAEGPLAPGMLATAFGSGLALRRESAASTPLPTELGGSRIAVVDSTGARRDAGLIFMDPSQANYYLPDQTALGDAVVSVEPDGGPAQQSAVRIERISPGLFFLNEQRLAAATLLRVAESGEQTFEQVFALNAQQLVEPLPIRFGPEGERLFLTIFGTGFRGRSALSEVTLVVDGLEHPLAYAGEQGAFVGLDQANAELLRALAGRGDVEVRLRVDGTLTNAVRLTFE